MKRWAVAGVILLLAVGGCRKADDEESAVPEREKRARPAVAARPARAGQQAQRIMAAPADEEKNPPPRIKAAPEDPEAPESSAPPVYVPPPAPGAAAPAPATPSYPPAARRLTKAEVEDRLKQHIQPAFIDVALTDY